MVISKKIVATAKKIHRARTAIKLLELSFSVELAERCRSEFGNNKRCAHEIRVSPQYMNDLVHGRRAVSDAVIEKIMGLSK